MSIRCFTVIFIFLVLPVMITAQPVITDTFIRKDGIHPVPVFEPWQAETLIRTKKMKGTQAVTQPLLPADACDRVKNYIAAFAGKKPEPWRFFSVLNQLDAHDSSSWFGSLSDMPLPYQSFFGGIYYMESNDFGTAIPLFERAATGDSLLLKEAPFWKDMAIKMQNEQAQHGTVLDIYHLMDQPRPDSVRLIRLLDQVTLPQYLVHKYINLYNFHYRRKEYKTAAAAYDSAVAHPGSSRLQASLVKNRTAVQEMLAGKENFIAVMRKGLYHYEVDYLYDHLEAWGQDKQTDRSFAENAGFRLHVPSTTATDSVFTRLLVDTAANEQLSNFEVLSFIRTPLDRGGRRFVIVKLDFNNDTTWNKYFAFMEKFKSKPLQQSVLYNRPGTGEGDEYMLTKHFIAALYKRNDPALKYELSLYLLEDAEGNVFAVDTLF